MQEKTNNIYCKQYKFIIIHYFNNNRNITLFYIEYAKLQIIISVITIIWNTEIICYQDGNRRKKLI